MLVKMRRQVFDSLEDTALRGACFEPFIPKIRGKDDTVKLQVYKELTTGQKALFMFNAYETRVSNLNPSNKSFLIRETSTRRILPR